MTLTKEQLIKLLEAAYGLADDYGTTMHFDVARKSEDYFELANCEGERCCYLYTNAFLREDILSLQRCKGVDDEEQHECFDVLMKASVSQLKQLIEE